MGADLAENRVLLDAEPADARVDLPGQRQGLGGQGRDRARPGGRASDVCGLLPPTSSDLTRRPNGVVWMDNSMGADTSGTALRFRLRVDGEPPRRAAAE
jgi:hypothetical protein